MNVSRLGAHLELVVDREGLLETLDRFRFSTGPLSCSVTCSACQEVRMLFGVAAHRFEQIQSIIPAGLRLPKREFCGRRVAGTGQIADRLFAVSTLAIVMSQFGEMR